MTVSEYDNCVSDYADNLYRFVLKSLRDTDVAKDVVQESFLRLWENREAVCTGKQKSYLFTIAYRLVIDNVRYDNRYSSNEVLGKMGNDCGGGYSNISEVLNEHLQRLPMIQKTLVMMRDYEGYSYREIAETTQLSEAQVKVYIFRARVALKKSIGNINNIL